jgi:phosphoribosyl 1,2-cyclic phosphodiesterase
MKVTFHGVRGSFPSVLPANRRYGGNTAAISVEVVGEPLLLLDLGTGLTLLDGAAGRAVDRDGAFEATALVTHLHFDHIQGLPFFPPVLEAHTVLDVYGPRQPAGSLRQADRKSTRLNSSHNR